MIYATKNRKKKEKKQDVIYASDELRNSAGVRVSDIRASIEELTKDINPLEKTTASKLGSASRIPSVNYVQPVESKYKYNGGFSSDEEKQLLLSAIKKTESDTEKAAFSNIATAGNFAASGKETAQKYFGGTSAFKEQLEAKAKNTKGEQTQTLKNAVESGSTSLDEAMKAGQVQELVKNAEKNKLTKNAENGVYTGNESYSQMKEANEEKQASVKAKTNELKTKYYSSIPNGEAETTNPKNVEYAGYAGSDVINGVDWKYEYINDINGTRSSAEASARLAGSNNKYLVYDNMDEREIGIYNYLYKNEGRDEAEKFLDFIKDDLNERQFEKEVEEAYEYGKEHKLSAWAKSTGTNLTAAVEEVGNLAKQTVGGKAKKNKNTALTEAYRSGITDTTDWMIGNFDAFDFVFGTAASGADSLLAMALSGGTAAGEVILGLTAAASTANDVIDRGGTNEQAFWSAITAGAFESLFEHISIGNFKALTETTPESFKDVVKNIGKSMLTNASEETFTEIANVLYDFAMNGGISQYETLVKQYTEEGMDEDKAKAEAAKQLGLQILEAGASGGLMGLGFGAAGSGLGYVTGKSNSSALTETESRVVDAVYEKLLSEEESDGKALSKKEKTELYKKAQSQLENGDISVDVIEEALGGDTYKKYRKAAENEEKLQGEYDTLNKMRRGDMTGEQTDRQNELKRQLEELKTGTEKESLKEKLQNEVYSQAKGSRLEESYNQRERRSQSFEAEEAEIKNEAERAIFEKAEKSGVLNDTKKTHDFVNMVARIAADKNIDFDFTSSARLRENGTLAEGESVGSYATGENGLALNINSEKALNGIVGHEVVSVLKNTGLYEQLRQAVSEYAETKGELSTGTDGVRTSENRLRVEAVGKGLGRKVIFESTEAVKGFTSDGYIDSDGTIHIDYNCKNPVEFVLKHELTHFAEGTEEYKGFAEAVKNSRAYEEWINARVEGEESTAEKTEIHRERITENYAANGVELTPEQAEAELIADFSGEVLFKEDGSGLEAIMSDMTESGKSRFVNFLKDFISYLKAKLSGNKTVSAEVLKLERMFNEALTAAEQKNTATEGGVKYSIAKDNDGENIVVIDTDQGLFVGVDESEYRKIAKDYLNEHFKNTVLPLSNYGLVTVNKTGIGKYTYSGKKIKNSANSAKMKAATELDNLLSTAEYIKSTGDRKNHNFAADGFDYYKTRFIVDGCVFEGIVDIGVSEKGAEFYGMTHIENVTSRYYGKYSNLLLGYKSVTQSDISDSRIPQDKTTVKNNISESAENYSENDSESNNKSTQASELTALIADSYSKNAFTDNNIPQSDTVVKNNISESTEKYSENAQSTDVKYSIPDSEAESDSIFSAEKVGEYLFSEEFAEKLATENRELFKRVFKEIKYLSKTAAEGSREAERLGKVKKTFEKAYKTKAVTEKSNVSDKTADVQTEEYSVSQSVKSKAEAEKTVNGEEAELEGIPIKKEFSERKATQTEAEDTGSVTDEVAENAGQTESTEPLKTEIKQLTEELNRETERLDGEIEKAKKDFAETEDKGSERAELIANRIEALKKQKRSAVRDYRQRIGEAEKLLKGLEEENPVKAELSEKLERYREASKKAGETYKERIERTDRRIRNAEKRLAAMESGASETAEKLSDKISELEAKKEALKAEYEYREYRRRRITDELEKELSAENTQSAERARALSRIDYDLKLKKEALKEEYDKRLEAERQTDIKKRAGELYSELKNHSKGSGYSELLNYFFDSGFNSGTLKEVLAKISRETQAAVNSTAEADIREALGNDYNERLWSVEEEYREKLEELESNADEKRANTRAAIQRKNKAREYFDEVKQRVGDTTGWKDKKLGISYEIHNLRRNLRDIVKTVDGSADIKTADGIYDWLQGSYNTNEAKLNREENKIKKSFADMKITSAESTYIQMLGELKYNPESRLTEKEVNDFYSKNKNKIDKAKVDGAIEQARKTYDSLLERVNTVLREQGMKEIPYRKGYFPHFNREQQSLLGKIFNWKTQDTTIPTDIAGLTENFNPERSWQSFNKKRQSDETDYNFLKGMDNYVHGALDWIYHIEDLQKRRAFENYLRYIHSDKGIRSRIDEITANPELDYDEVQAEIDNVLKEAENPLGNFLTDFRAQTNTLAGKKSTLDRSIEAKTNRKIYSTMTNIQSRVSGNMVAGSISSAFTNFIPITQSWGQVSPMSSLKAMAQTLKSTVKDDGTVAKSDFLTNRLDTAEKLYKNNWDKLSEKAGALMDVIDGFTSQTVWRSKYNENISSGMSESEAVKNADQFAENVLAGRSRGNNPTIFDSKNPVTKLFTVFQLEVANQYDYMLKDMPQDIKSEGGHWKTQLVKGYATMFLGAYVYNALYSALTGRDAAFDPIGIVKDLLDDMGAGDDDEKEEPADVILNLTDNIAEQLPFIGGLMGGGRVPISSAIPYDDPISAIKESITDLSDGNIEDLTAEWLKPITYVALPFGGGQLRKTVQGLKMFDDDLPISGSYTNSGDLRFTVEDTLPNRIKAGLFGQWANSNAEEYIDGEHSPLNEKQLSELLETGMTINDYWDYTDGLKGKTKLSEKADYIAGLDFPIATKNILINNASGREEDIDLTDYYNYSDFEEMDFAIKNPEKYEYLKNAGISVSEYENFDSETKEAYTKAAKNPEKYSVYTAVTDDLVKYCEYTKALSNIKSDKNAQGKAISGSRKAKVISYLNGLDIDYGGKIILYKSEYASDDTYNYEIIDYLNGREDISYSQMKTILEELGFTVLSDGSIKW